MRSSCLIHPLYHATFSTKVYTFLTIAFLLALPTKIQAQNIDFLQSKYYSQCIQTAQRLPDQGFEMGLKWQDDGGGLPAKHCTAIALMQLEQYSEAGKRLVKIAEEMPETVDPVIVSDVLGQAGLAYYLDDNLEEALNVQTAALKLAEENETLLIDRALTYVGLNNFLEAIIDLSNVIILNDRNYDAFIYRGAAYRQLQKYDLGLQDLSRVLEIDSENPDALLERGIIYRLIEENVKAQNDFLKIIEYHDGRPVAEMARANLQKIALDNSTK